MSQTKQMMEKIQPILDKYHLTEEEKGLLEKAKKQVKYNVFFAAVGGSFGGMVLALRRKPFSLIRMGLLSTGFAFIGTQVGFVAGYYSALKTIKSMPDQQKLRNMTKEILDLFQKEKQQRGLPILQPPDYKARIDPNSNKEGQLQPLPNNKEKVESNEDELFQELSGEKPEPKSEDPWKRLRQTDNKSKNRWEEIRQDGSDTVDAAETELLNIGHDKKGIRKNQYGDIILEEN